MLLGMIGLALVWLSQVPFRLAEVWWDRRYDQTDSGYVETLFANWFELGAEFLFICLALVIVMAIAGRFPRRWWLGAAPVFVGLAFLFGFVYPYLTPTDRLERADLQAAGREYAAKQGIDPIPLRVEDVTDFTSAPNAYAVGFGGSMIWFGSSAGVAISNMYPQAKSVGLWLRHGWHVAVAYVAGFIVMLSVLGWHPHAPAQHASDPHPVTREAGN